MQVKLSEVRQDLVLERSGYSLAHEHLAQTPASYGLTFEHLAQAPD